MLDLYGHRWTDTHGSEPSKLWTDQIERLSSRELRAATNALLHNASKHPPTLLEYLALAKHGRAPPQQTGARLMEQLTEEVNRRFPSMSARQRFARWSWLHSTYEATNDSGHTVRGVRVVGVVIPCDPVDPERHPAIRVMARDVGLEPSNPNGQRSQQ